MLKKIFVSLLGFLLVFQIVIFIHADDNIKINMRIGEQQISKDDKALKLIFIPDSGPLQIPIRDICKKLNIDVIWNNHDRSITLIKSSIDSKKFKRVKFKLGENVCYQDDKNSSQYGQVIDTLDSYAFYDEQNNTSYLPINVLSKILEYEMNIEKNENEINIAIDIDQEEQDNLTIPDILKNSPHGTYIYSLIKHGYLEDNQTTYNTSDYFSKAEFANTINNIYTATKGDNLLAIDNNSFSLVDSKFICETLYKYYNNNTTHITLTEKINFLKANSIIDDAFIKDIKRHRLISRGEAYKILCKTCNINLYNIKTNLPNKTVIDSEYISQLSPLYAPVGCEGTSLLMALKAKGYAKDVTLKMFLDAMPKHKDNPEKGFAGSPYIPDPKKKTRTTIFPPILTKFARNYGNVVDISGYDADEIKEIVLQGNPVVAYVTMYYEAPYYRTYLIEGNYVKYLSNNHIVFVAGYDKTTKKYYIKDPYNKDHRTKPLEYWIDKDKFDISYNDRKHALAVY